MLTIAFPSTVYDATRTKLLRGRKTMLRLSAAHLKEQKKKNPNKRLIWLDLGGGTGWNVEQMNEVCAPFFTLGKEGSEELTVLLSISPSPSLMVSS